MKALQFADRTTRPGVVQALEKLADAHIQNRTAIAMRLVRLASSKSANQEAAAEALASLAHKSWSNSEEIWSSGGIEALVALLTHASVGCREKAARALANLPVFRRQAGDRQWDHDYNCGLMATAITTAAGKPLVALLKNGTGCQEEAARALANITRPYLSHNLAAIAAAGGIEALVALMVNAAAAGSQEQAAAALGNLARDETICNAIVEAGGVKPLVALATNGATRGQEQAAWALSSLAEYAASKVAIVAAGAVEALSALLANGSDVGKSNARQALERLGPLAEYASKLQSENASLQRRLDRYEGSGAIDVTQDDDADDDAQHRDTGLREEYDRKARAHLVKVKEEKEALEDRVLCTICMEADAPRTVLFGPCNHFLACASCADALQECPNCRVPITARTSIANTS